MVKKIFELGLIGGLAHLNFGLMETVLLTRTKRSIAVESASFSSIFLKENFEIRSVAFPKSKLTNVWCEMRVLPDRKRSIGARNRLACVHKSVDQNANNKDNEIVLYPSKVQIIKIFSEKFWKNTESIHFRWSAHFTFYLIMIQCFHYQPTENA